MAVNCFEGANQYDLDEVQAALNLGSGVPVLLCDARVKDSGKKVLIALVQHAMETRKARAVASA